MEKEKFYITTAIAYTSSKPHIGNTYEVVFTDAIARFMRLIGKDVFFLTGTDEHGIKIQEYAEKAGIPPKEYVDKVSAQVKGVWDLMNTSYDKFIRTTDPEHEKTVSDIFTKLYEQGDIYKSEYSGWYCTPCETFYTETQLKDGRCPDCGAEVKKTREEAYFFKMSKYQKKLEEYIEQNPDFITPESRKKEMVNNFIKPGIQDLCVSRTTFNWGVPVKFDPKHVIYVWIDALSNYITALGYNVNGESGDLYKKYWPCDVHIIGKDILRFHTIYWPIMLMALGQPLPKQVFGHPWFLAGEDKMSKSKGNTIYADELVGYFGVDAVRFYLLSEMPYAQDGVITYSNVMTRYNSELANTLGNLVSRTMAMCKKYFGGVIPAPGAEGEFDGELKACAAAAVKGVHDKMVEYRVSEAVDELFNLLRRSNKYIDETMPWALAKTDEGKERLKTVIYNLLEAIRISAVLLTPFMTQTADKIINMLDTEKSDWQSVQNFGNLESGIALNDAEMLFARIDEAKMSERIAADIAAKAPAKPRPPKDIKPQITIDDFAKVELRVAKILECELVPKSDKLLKLQLDLGYETRQVVSGIAKFYNPSDLIGKKVVMCANLAPVKLRGVESCGMILASGEDDVKVLFADDDAPLGSGVR